MLLNISDWSRPVTIKWLASLALPGLLYVLLTTYGDPATLNPNMIMFLCITLWAVCAWAMNTLNDVAVGLLLPMLYVAFCGVKQGVVFRPWLGDVAIISIGGFVLGKIMGASGLGKRIALASVRSMGGSFVGAMAGLGIGAAIIAPLVPSIMGKAAIFTAIAVALCDALNFRAKTREASAVLLAACVAVGATKLCYLTGAGDLVMGMALADKVMGTHTMWMDYAIHNFVPGMLYMVLSIAIVLLVLRTKTSKKSLKASVETAYAELGPMAPEQKRATALLIFTLVMLATDKLHGFSAGGVLMFITALAFVPGISLMDGKRLTSVNFSPIFFIMGCMSIGAAGGALGVTDWLAGLVLPLLNGYGPTFTGVASYWVGAGLNFLLTPLAATSTITSPLVKLGMELNMEPRILYYAFQYGLDNIIFPYEYALYLYFYSSGYINFRDMALVLVVRMVLAAVFVGLVAIPWWSFII
ncbi:SLC13 family permease [Desulfovibrio piger]|uniref:SLC13 family permease n=1 Tax=Desulfovibrio piger TaxID=901 RepID=UPI0026EA356B|nr:SLC13 family permease [Desulfovibrio piger]